MNSRTLSQILSSNSVTAPHFIGTYPIDQIPTATKYPTSIVVNLDTSAEVGSHWVGLFIKSPTHALYFDSYGLKPEDQLLDYLKGFTTVTINIFTLQSLISNVCAKFVIFFIFMCSKGYSYESILQLLARKHNPDLYVQAFTESLVND